MVMAEVDLQRMVMAEVDLHCMVDSQKTFELNSEIGSMGGNLASSGGWRRSHSRNEIDPSPWRIH